MPNLDEIRKDPLMPLSRMLSDAPPVEEMTETVQINLSLGLARDFLPATSIEELFIEGGVERPAIFEHLRNSSRDEAKKMVTILNRMHPVEQRKVALDALIAACAVDPAVVVGLVTEEVQRKGASVAMLIAAAAHPEVMRKTIEFASEPEGAADRKLFLQIAGSAPVPKTSISNTYIRGDQNNNLQINNNNIPTLEDVVRSCDIEGTLD